MGITATAKLAMGCIIGDGPDNKESNQHWPDEWCYETGKYNEWDYRDYCADDFWDDMLRKEWEEHTGKKRGDEDYYEGFVNWSDTQPVSLLYTCCFDYPIFVLAITSSIIRADWDYPVEFTADKLVVPDSEFKKAYDWVREHGFKNIEFEWTLSALHG